jgi:hypothetical protein
MCTYRGILSHAQYLLIFQYRRKKYAIFANFNLITASAHIADRANIMSPKLRGFLKFSLEIT